MSSLSKPIEKLLLGALPKEKKAPAIEDESQKFIWQMLYGDSFVDVTERDCVGYLKRAHDVINYLGNNFEFEQFKKHVINFDGFQQLLLQIEETNKIRSFATLTQHDKNPEKTEALFENDVCKALLSRYEFMYKEERYGSGESFRDSARSLLRFYLHYRNENKELFKNNEDYTVKFEMLTESFLNKYERWMYRFGKRAQKKKATPTSASPSTVGIYTRNFRTVFNLAIKTGVTDEGNYPFGKGKYVIPGSRNIKKARTIEEIEQIIDFQCTNESDLLGRDMWLFSYLGNGANMADILRIKWRDLEDDRFSFIRRKTKNTKKKDLTPIQVYIYDLAQEIIARWERKVVKKMIKSFHF